MRKGAVAPLAVRDAIARTAARLAAAGCDSPRLDAELLLGSVVGADRAQLVMLGPSEVPAGELERLEALVARREAREPVAYILGAREFRRLTLAVDARVLIPRPETELLVEAGLSLPRAARVCDVGTGSGAVALALKDERPDLAVTGLDVDPGALAVARANGARLGLDVRWGVADLVDAARYDAVVANLPYVEDGAVLAPEIALHEPAAALYAGADGLDVIRRLVERVRGRDEVSLLALEIGAGQANAVAELVRAAGFSAVERLRDLAGHERVITGRR